MTMKSKGLVRALAALLSIATVSAAPGCTIIRYRDPVEENNKNNTKPDPKIVDMLVMVELNRSAVSLAPDYQTMILSLIAGLALKNVTVRKMAIAPMYSRTGNAVPLIYGQDDPDAEFASPGEAIAFFANDDAQNYLTARADADGKNLADVGMELDTRAIYHPTTADSEGRPYFGEPGDGFVVVSLTAKARSCAYKDAGCKLGGQEAAVYLSKEDGDGLEWLEFANGKRLPRERVFHLSIATSERLSGGEFDQFCENQQEFPASKLDFIEPSPLAYYEPLTTALGDRDVPAHYTDLCVAMSSPGQIEIAGVSGEIAGMF
jgi:hypothetical protein